MAVEIPTPLVEFILLGPTDDRRQLQESPILGDVWIAYANQPTQPVDLLITPVMTCPAGGVANTIQQRLNTVAGDDAGDPQISYLQGTVAARLRFQHLLQAVVPLTQWFVEKWAKEQKRWRHQFQDYRSTNAQAGALGLSAAMLQAAGVHFGAVLDSVASDVDLAHRLTPDDRYIVLSGLILWAARENVHVSLDRSATSAQRVIDVLKQVSAQDLASELERFFDTTIEDPVGDRRPLVFKISRNRKAKLALEKSVAAVKGDAASNLFKVDCSGIGWAVLDSGIDARHPAFSNRVKDRDRVRRCFDFSRYRKVVNLGNARDAFRERNLAAMLEKPEELESFRKAKGADKRHFAKRRGDDLKELARDAQRGGAIQWELVERFVEIAIDTPPLTNHGTHVAGIIGASKEAALASGKERAGCANGMCPDIALYDFRVVGQSLEDTEFAIIAALQYIRYLNDRDRFLTIHGANLSLSIPHDVRNYACGSTPICAEAERLVESGVVVVAAAGNHGYKSFETRDGTFESYAAFSITDPGNAEDVITVGSTHRHWPHTYGVSFFSSRGPTGDGRLKPDLVAPGERIRAPFPGGAWGDLDGTSMSAPHVSGAAAMLMARHSELIGRPRRIKKILCESATDLGRERSFQGHGMLDVLRAIQSI